MQILFTFRQSLVEYSLFLANELAYKHNLTWANITEVHQRLDEALLFLDNMNDLYKYGDHSEFHQSPGAIGRSDKLDYMAFDLPCELPEGGECTGIEMMLQEYIR